MIIRFFFIVIYGLMLFSCKNAGHSPQTENILKNKQRYTDKYTVHIDTLRLPNPFTEEAFGNYTTYYIENDSSFLVIENCIDLQLHVYNLFDYTSFSLDDKELKCRRSHNMHFLSRKSFLRLDESGSLVRYNDGHYNVIDNLTTNTQLRFLGLWQGGSLDYSNEIIPLNDSIIMFPLDVNPDHKHKVFSKYDFGYPITGFYNLNTKKILYDGLTYPKFLFDKNYGLFTKIEQKQIDDNILYSFVSFPEIWRYDRKEKSIERFLVKSIYDTIPTPALNFKRTPKTKDLVFQHFKTSSHYKHLIYDPYKNLFYRFYALPLPDKTKDGLYTTYQDRRFCVMILDKEFNILAERILPEECFFIYFAVPTKNGLFINYGPFKNTNQDGIKILKVNLEVNN